MALRVRAAIAALLSSHHDQSHHVHFHNGPHAQPVPCFEHSCPRPRLSVD